MTKFSKNHRVKQNNWCQVARIERAPRGRQLRREIYAVRVELRTKFYTLPCTFRRPDLASVELRPCVGGLAVAAVGLQGEEGRVVGLAVLLTGGHIGDVGGDRAHVIAIEIDPAPHHAFACNG